MDGDGMKGLATVQMLKQIHEGTGKRIHEMFDLICGTSTGGVLAIALGIKQMTLEQCEEIYKKLGGSIINNESRRAPLNRTDANCDLYQDLEGGYSAKKKFAVKSNPEPVVKEVPKELTFTCPVCLNTMVEPSSTICGHVFCKSCIKAAIQAQKKCPNCRRKLSMNNFHRVYLPNSE